MTQLPADQPGARVAPFRHHNDMVWDGERVTCATTAEHANVVGGIHGGVMATMLDSVMGGTVILHIPADRAAVTSSLTVNFLRGARVGDTLVARATVRRVGRTVAHVDGTCVREHDGEVVATATGTFAITDRRTAQPSAC